MTSHFQDGGHDVRSPLPVPGCNAYCNKVRRLPVSSPSACDVIGSLYALEFLIRSTFALVFNFNFICTGYIRTAPGKTVALG